MLPGREGKNHSPLRLLSARRRWAVKDNDLFLAKSLAAIIAQIPGIIEGDPDSLFAAVAAVFLLARHARSKGCRLTKDETSALVCLKSAGRGISALRLARLLGWPEEKAEEVLAGLKEARLEDGSTASFVVKDRRTRLLEVPWRLMNGLNKDQGHPWIFPEPPDRCFRPVGKDAGVDGFSVEAFVAASVGDGIRGRRCFLMLT